MLYLPRTTNVRSIKWAAAMAKLNKIKPDTILKNFWKNNDRFADLFNTFLFNGKEILKPDDLTEVDTDVSSMLKFYIWLVSRPSRF